MVTTTGMGLEADAVDEGVDLTLAEDRLDPVGHAAPLGQVEGLAAEASGLGQIGIPGLYVTEDPGAADDAAKQGALSMRFGLGWPKSHSFPTGQCPVMKYHRPLMQAILFGKVNIADAVNVQMITLDQAPRGYADFDGGAATKFVIDPHGSVAA